jgi:predicted NBD/HSP70 family sugar kinase
MRKLIELVESGDPAAAEAVGESARYLGLGIAGLINGLDPDVIVVGGEITRAWGLIEPIISQGAKGSLLGPRASTIPIRRSAFEVRPSLKGALTLVLNELLSVPPVG